MADADGRPGADQADGVDLLTIGLLVFFIALLLTVAALLVLPMILG
ncbi:MAG TPA: hypothetical protein VH987_01090 [Candidatus Limnocylindria bacterium]